MYVLELLTKLKNFRDIANLVCFDFNLPEIWMVKWGLMGM